MLTRYPRIASLKNSTAFKNHLEKLRVLECIPFDPNASTPNIAALSNPLTLFDGSRIGNRFCIQPMEGWDATPNGIPTELVRRRWRTFGESGAKLIWGGEATAVNHTGRANPNQLRLEKDTATEIDKLLASLIESHEKKFDSSDDLLVGLQLTHSGRFCRPKEKDKIEPVSLYKHHILDEKFNLNSKVSLASDNQIESIIDKFVEAGTLAYQIGFNFVDIKHCHGYLGHEFLSSFERIGPFGGTFENRTRFLRSIITRLQKKNHDYKIGVRLSAFDFVPFEASPDNGYGIPVKSNDPYQRAFGLADNSSTEIDLTEPIKFLSMLKELGVFLINITAGSPYYSPHIQRPSLFPPSDGYKPPEDPLKGVARQIEVVHKLKKLFPELIFIGSGYSYLQEWLPYVAGEAIAKGFTDFIGLGRISLSYPHIVNDILSGKKLERKLICRTFSDCTTAPRHGMISGCFPLDPFYRDRSEFRELKKIKSKKIST